MKRILVLVFFLFLIGGAYAYDLNACAPSYSGFDSNNTDFNAIGNCIMRGAFASSPLFFALIFLALMIIFLYQSQLPFGPALGIGLIVFFALSPFLSGYYSTLVNLTLLVIGAMVGLAILKFVRR